MSGCYNEKAAAFAEKHNLIYGFGSAEPFYEYKEALSRQVPFVGYTPKQRLDPALTLKGAKGLVAIGLSYNECYSEPTERGLYGRLSQGAVGEDYHLKMGELLKELGELLFTRGEKYMCFCDTGPLCDSLVALRCGLGFLGLNHGVISEKFGSMFFIGYIITTAELELDPTAKKESRCHSCGLCVKGCPSGALKADGNFEYERCVAYLTQKKGVIPNELKPLMGTYIYGCDICRQVCPLTPTPTVGGGCPYTEIEGLLSLSNREFKERYGNTAIGWRGKAVIARNALIALGNIGDREGLRLIKPYLDSDRAELRDAALWAWERISGRVNI